MPTLTKIYQVDTAVFGQITGIYYIGYALAHIPIGYGLDRYGPRKIASFSLLISLLGLIPLLFSTWWPLAAIGRMVTGIGSAAAILGSFTVIRLSFPENQFSRMLGFTATIGLLGAIYGGKPVKWLMDLYSWQTVILLLLATGGILTIALWFFLPSKTLKSSDTIDLSGIVSIFSNPKVLFICIAGGLMVGPLEGFADVWGVEFLSKVHHIDKGYGAFLTSLVFFGFCFGAPIISWIGDQTKAYYGVIRWCALTMAAIFFAIIFFPQNDKYIGILLTIVGVASAYQIFIIYKTISYVPKNLAGQASAIGNMLIMLFGYLFHSSIGGTMKFYDGVSCVEPNMYSLEAFRWGLTIIPLAQIIAYGLLFCKKDKRN